MSEILYRWVKVSERLPEVNQDVCIKFDDTNRTAYYDGEGAFIIEGSRFPLTLYYIEWLSPVTLDEQVKLWEEAKKVIRDASLHAYISDLAIEQLKQNYTLIKK